MATLVIIAVHDRQLDSYLRPFVAQSIGQAIRSFRDEVNRTDSDLNKHPEDYTLFHIGNYDEQTGAITSITASQIAIAHNLIERKTS